MNEYKIISQKKVYSAKLFEVREVEIKLPNGTKRIHHVAERVPTISVFPLTNSYELYLVSQYRYLLKKVMLEAVAGFIGKNETSIKAAKRELKEETGIHADQWEEIARVDMASSVFKSKAHLFLAKGLEMGSPQKEVGEDITLVKVSLNDAVNKVLSGEINNSISMVGILLLDKLKKERKL